MTKANTFSALVAPLVAALTFPSPTPENTPIPGGGSWRWDVTLPGWSPNTPDHPLHPGTVGTLQTLDPNQE